MQVLQGYFHIIRTEVRRHFSPSWTVFQMTCSGKCLHRYFRVVLRATPKVASYWHACAWSRGLMEIRFLRETTYPLDLYSRQVKQFVKIMKSTACKCGAGFNGLYRSNITVLCVSLCCMLHLFKIFPIPRIYEYFRFVTSL